MFGMNERVSVPGDSAIIIASPLADQPRAKKLAADKT